MKILKKLFVLLMIFILGMFICFLTRKTTEDNSKQIVFWSIQLKPVYEKQMNQIINEFETKHQGYKIKWIDIPIQEAQKRTLASILSSTPPDLINLNPNFSLLLAQKDTLYIFDKKDTAQFNKNLVEKLKYDGKIYALPFYATSAVTIYNKENLSEKIKTYDDLFKIAQKTKGSLYANSLNENDTLVKILGKYNILFLDSDKEIQKTAEIFSKFNQMYKLNQMPKDTLALSHREVIEKYMSNQTSMIVAGSNFIDMIKKSAPDIYKKSEITYQLTGENGEYDISLMNLIIPKRAKNKELALEFALLLTNTKNQLEFAKLTNVLPANALALEDDYFKNCSADLYDKSRCLSAHQLNNIIKNNYSGKNQTSINEAINKTFEEILLDKKLTPNSKETLTTIELKVKNLAKEIKILQKN